MFSPNKSYVWSGRAQSGHIVEGVYKASQVASVEIGCGNKGLLPSQYRSIRTQKYANKNGVLPKRIFQRLPVKWRRL